MPPATFDVRIVLDDKPAKDAMRQIRKTLNSDTRRALGQAAERIALPAAKAGTPKRSGTLAASLVARSSTRNAYLTTSLTRKQGSRRLGLLEFGGTRRDVIVPRRAKALRLPDGGFVARVGGSSPGTIRRVFGMGARGRKYRAQGFMYRAVESKRGEVTEYLADKMAEAAQRAIDSRSPYPY